MADKAPEKTAAQVDALFNTSMTDLDAIRKVGDHIRTGRRWDVTHKDVVKELIVIHSFKEINTQYGPAGLCKIDHRGQEKMVLMGGSVLLDQLKDLEKVLPVMAVIRKPARSYTFTDPTEAEITAYKKDYR